MTATHVAGPFGTFGNLRGSTNTANAEAGPSWFYQGTAIPDTRGPSYEPGKTGPGQVRGFQQGGIYPMVDAVPAASGAAKIAPAQAVTSGAPMAFAAGSAGVSPGVPVLALAAPSRNVNVVVRAVGLDMGLTTCTTTAGSRVLSAIPGANLLLPVNQTIVVNAGTAGAWLLARVLSTTTNTVTLDTPMTSSVAGALIATADNAFNAAAPLAVTPWVPMGAMAVFDTTQTLSRGVSVTSSAGGDAGWSVLVSGFDAHLVPMTQTLAVTAGGVVSSTKAFKYISSVTPTKAGGGTSTGTFSVGTTGLVGFNLRLDRLEYLDAWWNGARLAAATGITFADTTAPATGATGDTRGTVLLDSTAGGAPDGTKRLVLRLLPPTRQITQFSVADQSSLLGVTQA